MTLQLSSDDACSRNTMMSSAKDLGPSERNPLERTNNDTEGWNHKWNRAIGKNGPGYYDAVIQLRMQQADTENNSCRQIAAGVPPPPTA